MNSESRLVQCSIDVPASIDAVWKAWTHSGTAKQFFAVDANIEPRPGGAYELIFDPSAPEGQKGAEGMQIMAIQEPEFLSFTWNAPPHLPTVRGQRTFVEVRLSKIDKDRTHVTLEHRGWGTTEEWDAAFAYFERAWGKIVLPRLKYFFETGPIDWSNPPAI